MKNGTRSSSYLDVETDLESPEARTTASEELAGSRAADEVRDGPRGVFAFVAVSLGCAVAAVAAGSYALWLSRQQAARETLTDVHDILRTCQDRMQKIEADLNRMPTGVSVL